MTGSELCPNVSSTDFKFEWHGVVLSAKLHIPVSINAKEYIIDVNIKQYGTWNQALIVVEFL